MEEILDDLHFEEEDKYGKLLSLILAIVILVIWILLFSAKDLPYDANYANLMIAMLISSFSCVGLLVISSWKSQIIRNNMIATVVFLISSSPVSLVFVFLNYKSIFGKMLAI